MSTLKEELEAILAEKGRLTPALVVNAARNKRHPLHDRFEWDDAVAGEKYRQHQARKLIQSVEIVYRPATGRRAEGRVRAFHSIPGPTGRTYDPVEEIADDPFRRQLLLSAMEREWQALRDKYKHFQEFAAMVQRDMEDVA